MSYKLAGAIWNDDGTMAAEKTMPLEALDIIVKNKGLNGIKECVETLETTLKDHETLKREHEFLREHYNELLKDYNDLQAREFSQKQALDIIKKCMKGNADLFIWEHEVVGKGTVYYCFGKKVTKSQYDFLMRLLS